MAQPGNFRQRKVIQPAQDFRQGSVAFMSRDSGSVVIEGEHFDLIPYGSERDEQGRDVFDGPCHTCGALPGARHGAKCAMGAHRIHRRPATCRDCGCDIGRWHKSECGVEQCPRCGGQYASCRCDSDEDSDVDEEMEGEV